MTRFWLFEKWGLFCAIITWNGFPDIIFVYLKYRHSEMFCWFYYGRQYRAEVTKTNKEADVADWLVLYRLSNYTSRISCMNDGDATVKTRGDFQPNISWTFTYIAHIENYNLPIKRVNGFPSLHSIWEVRIIVHSTRIRWWWENRFGISTPKKYELVRGKNWHFRENPRLPLFILVETHTTLLRFFCD